MTTQHRQSIASGKPYLVVAPAAGVDSSLDAFLGDAEFSIDSGGEPLVIRGHGITHGELVRFHEKDSVGGKDVRVWHITERSGGYVAESQAAF
ncbi:hypothetical protein [Modestobacter excelsi]|uniref:hypothetical protein n=1 Tax=Modestobacter excelsi TaxID=2213161 RepID=UPI00110CE87F|nr:hypothetical protein [Modestobacter excelsi]